MSPGAAARLERHQVLVAVAAIALGALVGLLAPTAGPRFAPLLTPVLGVLLYVTFLQVPARDLVAAARPGRFLGAALTINFVVVPLLVAAAYGLLPDDPATRLGVLLVLLTPCVDYVVAFCGLAGGAADRLLAATPLLLLVQLALLPVFLVAFLGPAVADVIEVGPFVTAFGTLIALPLALAWLTQAWAARRATGRSVAAAAGPAMVPLVAATLFVVVASQLPRLGDGRAVLPVLPLYLAFLAVMPVLGRLVARGFRLEPRSARAIVFTGATRNSLVVLPLALALPDALAAAAVVVVAQTPVEVVGMAVYVRAVPRLLPLRGD